MSEPKAADNLTVVVGNIGTVYDGPSRTDANRKFREYVKQSKETGCRASGEQVTLFVGEYILREYRPAVHLPGKMNLLKLLRGLKASIGDDYRASGCEDDPNPSMDVTTGWTPHSGAWSYQTGDNSFTGGAYGHPVWAVITLDRKSNSKDLVIDIRNQLLDQMY
jgi:hypothetical protein